MRKRILLITLLITFFGIIGFWIISSEIYYNNIVEYSKDNLKVYMNVYSSDIPLNNDSAKELSQDLNGARITFMELDGVVIADSEKEDIKESHANREEVIEAIQNGEGYAIRSSETLGENMLYYCKKIDGKLIRLAIPTSSEWKVLNSSFSTIVWFLVFDIVVCFIFAFFSTIYILSPVEQFVKDTSLKDTSLKELQLKKVSPKTDLKKKYPELVPIIEILDKKNEEIKKVIDNLEEEKKQVLIIENSKNEFIANVTHEMNTPLTSIVGFAELLQKENLDEATKQKALKNITKQGEKLSNLIACIINYNEIDNDELPSYEINISKVAKEVIESLEPMAYEYKVTLSTDIDNDIMIYSRYERINEILGNLIRNAIKYNKESGYVKVIIKNSQCPYLTVEDNGVGIAEENIDKIFDRFYTIDKSHNGKNGGFGLGLAVVKKICKKAGWKLSCSSKLDVGTTFKIEF